MAGKAINEYNAFTGNPDAVNILVQEKSQGTDHSQAEHKKADLDALLNKKIVQTITDNDTTHVPSADAVYDALLTESTARANADTTLGHNITAEATARANADTTLVQRINANSKEIANLKQKAGDEIVVDYPSQTYGMDEVPANVAEYAEVKALRGVSRVDNNLIPTNKSTGSYTASADTSSYDEVANYFSSTDVQCVSGHTYLMVANVTRNISTNNQLALIMWPTNMTGNAAVVLANGESNGQVCSLYTANGNGYFNRISLNNYNGKRGFNAGDSASYSNLCFKDLNVYFGTTDLSFLGATNDAKLATIQQNYPELLEPSEYNTGSVVFPTYSAVKSYGIAFENKTISSGGAEVSANTRVCTPFIAVTPSSSLNIKLVGYDSLQDIMVVATYDSNKGFINVIYQNSKDATVNLTPSMHYIRVVCRYSDDANTSPADWLNKLYIDDIVYRGVLLDTLTLPEPVTPKGAGSVSEEYYPETGRVTHPIGQYTFTGNETWNYYPTPDLRFYFQGLQSLIKKIANNVVTNIIFEGFLPTSASIQYNQHPDFSIASDASGNVFLYVASWVGKTTAEVASLVAGKTIYFELATPSADTYVDPLPDPFIQVEGGGTIKPVQSQSIKIDHAFTAEYLAI